MSNMSERKVNLEEIFEKQNPQDGKLPEWVRIFAKEACRQVLELVTGNVGFIETTPDELNSEEYKPFITADDGTVWTFDKQSILDTINQVE